MKELSNFLKLVHNENIKIYVRVRTWVMLGILLLIALTVPLLVSLSSDQISVWDGAMLTMLVCFFLLTIFTVIVSADIVAGEFSWGTIKLLLIRPWSRTKILISKYIAVILFSLFGTALLAAGSILTSALALSPESFIPTGEGSELTPAQYAFAMILTKYVTLFIILTFAFMVSSVFRSGALAIGLSLGILFLQNFVGMFLVFLQGRAEWVKYLLVSHLDLTVYIDSPVSSMGTTLGFSITVLAAYYIVFLAVSWLVFIKRDVSS